MHLYDKPFVITIINNFVGHTCDVRIELYCECTNSTLSSIKLDTLRQSIQFSDSNNCIFNYTIYLLHNTHNTVYITQYVQFQCSNIRILNHTIYIYILHHTAVMNIV